LHGLLVWALATLLTAVIGLATAQSLTRLAAPSGGQAGPSTSVGGENLIAYDLDRLFRAERRPNADLDYPRAEAARILLTTSSHRGMQPEDRAYLVRLVVANTGLAQPDAERRVGEVAARAKENISRARRSAVILAFTAGAAALLGAVVCWFAACAGGCIVWSRKIISAMARRSVCASFSHAANAGPIKPTMPLASQKCLNVIESGLSTSPSRATPLPSSFIGSLLAVSPLAVTPPLGVGGIESLS
jgi:hypothetical protein